MNDYSQPPPGKISEHGNGIGAPSPEEVERRAREIAMIDERNPDECTETDWAQARHELMGEENNVPPEETPDNADMTEEWSVVASSKGHRIPRPGTEEEETVGEHLVIEGIEEATHDQMLEARREERHQEGENPLGAPSVKPVSQRAAGELFFFPASHSRIERLRDRFHEIRKFTNSLCVGLEPEDCVVQSMPDVSPTKWHLAHTTWFFETF